MKAKIIEMIINKGVNFSKNLPLNFFDGREVFGSTLFSSGISVILPVSTLGVNMMSYQDGGGLSRYRSTSIAAIQPNPAAVTAWR